MRLRREVHAGVAEAVAVGDMARDLIRPVVSVDRRHTRGIWWWIVTCCCGGGSNGDGWDFNGPQLLPSERPRAHFRRGFMRTHRHITRATQQAFHVRPPPNPRHLRRSSGHGRRQPVTLAVSRRGLHRHLGGRRALARALDRRRPRWRLSVVASSSPAALLGVTGVVVAPPPRPHTPPPSAATRADDRS